MTTKLLEVCKNPRFAGFNHCLFDAVAALICATASDAATLEALEVKLFPCFDHVLQAEVEEFQPYVFQVFALLIAKSQQLQRAYVDVRTTSTNMLHCSANNGVSVGTPSWSCSHAAMRWQLCCSSTSS